MVVEKRPAAEASRPGWPEESLSGKGLRMSSPADAPAVPPAAPPPAPTAPPAVEPPRPTIAELFLAFAAISLSGFGGVLAWARRIMVERRRWFTAEQFNEAFALCAFLPGGNMVNFAAIFGRGPFDALAAVAGLLGPPVVLIIAVGALYAHYGGERNGDRQRRLLQLGGGRDRARDRVHRLVHARASALGVRVRRCLPSPAWFDRFRALVVHALDLARARFCPHGGFGYWSGAAMG